MIDLFILLVAIIGTILCVSLFALNDWDIEKTMFKKGW